ncbi:hypothetical protein FACS189443_4610 [Planctomycetales bacterium]|nr:hypothetical protein FACS189443_4610 [Planctomycetales bacterium]
MTEVIAKPKKTKWHYTAAVISFVFWFWCLGGVEVFLLRDIPLLLILCMVMALLHLPVARWLGKPDNKWILLIVYFVAIIIAAALLFVIPPFFISRQTTYLTEPRAKNYYGIDYLTAIEQRIAPNVPPEDNGFRFLLEKFGRPLLDGRVITDDHWNDICEKLNLPAEIEPSVKYAGWYEFMKKLPEEERKIVEKKFCEDISPPFSDEQLPIVKRWLDENNPAIELFAEAARKPAFYTPLVGDPTIILALDYSNDVFRKITRALSDRIYYKLARSDSTGAWEDAWLQFHLYETHRSTVWNFLTLYFNAVLRSAAFRSAESVLLYGNWKDDELRQKSREIEPFLTHDPKPEIKAALLGERFAHLDLMQRPFESLNKDEKSPFELFMFKHAVQLTRPDPALKNINRFFDQIDENHLEDTIKRLKLREESKPTGAASLVMLWGWYGQLKCFYVGFAEMILYVKDSDCERLSFHIHRRETESSLTRLLFALELYRRNHENKYPESLDELRNGYLDTIPLDPFSKQPFRYSLDTDRRGYLIYSVGSNGIDEGGRNNNDTPKGDDIRRQIRSPADSTAEDEVQTDVSRMTSIPLKQSP